MELYGYPGPQVPRYPKLVPHQHTLPWNKENRNGKASITKGKISPESTADRSGSSGKPTSR